MQLSSINRPRVAVIGGGITGLAAAHRLTELSREFELTLFDAASKLGGVLQTRRESGFLIESAADCFITDAANPQAMALAERLGVAGELLETCPQHQRAMIVKHGRLFPVPDGFQMFAPVRLWPMLTTRLLGVPGKLRLAMESFVRPSSSADEETLEDFAVRRVGREAYRWIVQPLVGGIYTADPTKLSVQAALPQFVAMERDHGSLTRGLRNRAKLQSASAQEGGARYSMFRAPAKGMQSFVQAIAARLPSSCIRLNCKVVEVSRSDSEGWALRSDDESLNRFNAIIIALSATEAGRLVQRADSDLASELESIAYASTVVVNVGYRRQQISHPLDAFGFVVPSSENRPILAASFSSNKFPQRANCGDVLIRVFLGGALQPEFVELPAAKIEQVVVDQLSELLGIEGSPRFLAITRWRNVTPQYHLGHQSLVRRIQSKVETQPGIELAGNAYGGIGIPQCIRSGEQAATRIVEFLHGRP